jgi:hypothetical protein
VLELVDDALYTAGEARTKASKQVNDNFERAIRALCDYERDCYLKDLVSDDRRGRTVRERMAAAKAKDKDSSTTLNALKERLTKVRVALATLPSAHTCPQPTPDGWSESQEVVTFFLFKSLPDNAPLVVQRECQLSTPTRSA